MPPLQDFPRPDVHTCLTPRLLPLFNLENTVVVVIDVLRATSAICTGFEYGVEAILPVASLEEAFGYRESGYLLAGERDALPVEGFDFGNSPFSFMSNRIAGQTVVLTTTNGTQSIEQARKAGADTIVIGSFINLTALAEWLIEQRKNTVLLCAGWRDHFNLEDTLLAGALAELLVEHFNVEDDASLAARHLYAAAKPNLFEYIKQSSHYRRLARQGIEDDIRYCLTPDQSRCVPVLQGACLVDRRLPEEA